MDNGNSNASSTPSRWTNTQAYAMAVICLVMGFAVGYLLRGSASPEAPPAAAVPPPAAAPVSPSAPPAQPRITPQQLKQMADAQARPLMQRLESEPRNAQLLAEIGNLYYDAQQYATARDYYERSLKIEPGNTNVRVDLGTVRWYLGDPDKAIEEYKTVLKAEPTKPNALMNLGVVEWQGKMNVPAAVAAWEKLLATNPNFEGRRRVEQLITQAKMHSNLKPGVKGNQPPM